MHARVGRGSSQRPRDSTDPGEVACAEPSAHGARRGVLLPRMPVLGEAVFELCVNRCRSAGKGWETGIGWVWRCGAGGVGMRVHIDTDFAGDTDDWGVSKILDRDSQLRGSVHARATPEVQPAVQG